MEKTTLCIDGKTKGATNGGATEIRVWRVVVRWGEKGEAAVGRWGRRERGGLKIWGNIFEKGVDKRENVWYADSIDNMITISHLGVCLKDDEIFLSEMW